MARQIEGLRTGQFAVKDHQVDPRLSYPVAAGTGPGLWTVGVKDHWCHAMQQLKEGPIIDAPQSLR